MPAVEIVRTVPASVEQVFAAVADLADYGRYIPLTTIEHDRGPIGVGWRFTARTGLGPVALVDRMKVTRWEPSHGFGVVKLGPVLDGWAEVHLTAEAGGTRLVWREEIVPRPAALGRRLAPLSDRLTALLFGRAVDAMAARAVAG